MLLNRQTIIDMNGADPWDCCGKYTAIMCPENTLEIWLNLDYQIEMHLVYLYNDLFKYGKLVYIIPLRLRNLCEARVKLSGAENRQLLDE